MFEIMEENSDPSRKTRGFGISEKICKIPKEHLTR